MPTASNPARIGRAAECESYAADNMSALIHSGAAALMTSFKVRRAVAATPSAVPETVNSPRTLSSRLLVRGSYGVSPPGATGPLGYWLSTLPGSEPLVIPEGDTAPEWLLMNVGRVTWYDSIGNEGAVQEQGGWIWVNRAHLLTREPLIGFLGQVEAGESRLSIRKYDWGTHTR